MNTKSKKLNLDIQRLLDVFTGADGGLDFIALKFFLEDLEEEQCVAIADVTTKLVNIINFAAQEQQ